MIRRLFFLVAAALLPSVALAQSGLGPISPRTSSGSGTTTITAGTTATSGCTDGGFLYSLSSLVRCGANAINDGTTVTMGAILARTTDYASGSTPPLTVQGSLTGNIQVWKNAANAQVGQVDVNGYLRAPRYELSASANYVGVTSNIVELVGTNANAGVGGAPSGDLLMVSGANVVAAKRVAMRGYNGTSVTDIFAAINTTAGLPEGARNGAGWDQSGTKTITNTTATAFVRVAITSNGRQGGVIDYCVDSSDASDYQTRCGMIPFSGVNKAGTETCDFGTATDSVSVSAGTLTLAWTMDTTPANACDLQVAATSSLTPTTLRINYSVRLFGNAFTTVTAQ